VVVEPHYGQVSLLELGESRRTRIQRWKLTDAVGIVDEKAWISREIETPVAGPTLARSAAFGHL
jgi:hypothetical protein